MIGCLERSKLGVYIMHNNMPTRGGGEKGVREKGEN